MKTKTFLAALLTSTMLLSLCACGGYSKTILGDDTASASTTTTTVGTTTATAVATTTTTIAEIVTATTTTTKAITTTKKPTSTTTTAKPTTTTKKPTITTKAATKTTEETATTTVTAKPTTTTKKTTTTTKATAAKTKTIKLFEKTTYYGVTGYFYKAPVNGFHDIFIDPTIVGLPADYSWFHGVCTEYYCEEDGVYIWFATDLYGDWGDTTYMVQVRDSVDGGAGRFTVPVKTEGDMQLQTIKLREKTTYMGYTGYFYEREHNSSSAEDPNEDPTVLGLPANTPIISGLLTEYCDVYTRKDIYFAIAHCPHHAGIEHRDDCDALFCNNVLATGEPFQIWVRTGLVE